MYDDFTKRMEFCVKRLIQNDILAHPVDFNKTDIERSDVGAMVTDRLFDKLEGLIESAVKDGARLLVGGARWVNKNFEGGHYFTPTLLVDVTPQVGRLFLFRGVQLTFRFFRWRLRSRKYSRPS